MFLQRLVSNSSCCHRRFLLPLLQQQQHGCYHRFNIRTPEELAEEEKQQQQRQQQPEHLLNNLQTRSGRRKAQEQEEQQKQRHRDDHARGKPSMTEALFLLGIPVITFCLGVWQVNRRQWKLAVIEELKKRTSQPAIPLPPIRDEELVQFATEFEYYPFRVRGHFLHDREVLITTRFNVGPRDYLNTSLASQHGAYVVTPFALSDGSQRTILVNRGFVPHTHFSPETRQAGQTSGECELVGLLRTNELRNSFMAADKPQEGEWHCRDVERMSHSLSTAPIFLDAIDDVGSNAPEAPVGGQTIVNLRNEHMSYLITWFTLSFLTSIMWLKRYSPLFLRR